jgi:hypothetical protein
MEEQEVKQRKEYPKPATVQEKGHGLAIKMEYAKPATVQEKGNDLAIQMESP